MTFCALLTLRISDLLTPIVVEMTQGLMLDTKLVMKLPGFNE
jgi:hypothetical protein